MAEFGLGDDQAGEECPECVREPERKGDLGQRQTNEERAQQKNLPHPRCGDRPQQPRHQLTGDKEYDAHCRDAQREPERHVPGGRLRTPGEDRGKDDDRNDREILEEGDADRKPAVGSVEIIPVGQHLQHDRRAAQHDDKPQEHALAQIEQSDCREHQDHDSGRSEDL